MTFKHAARLHDGGHRSNGAARASNCQMAVMTYNSSMDELLNATRRLHGCVANSRGTDDCSTEFSRVRSQPQRLRKRAVSDFTSPAAAEWGPRGVAELRCADHRCGSGRRRSVAAHVLTRVPRGRPNFQACLQAPMRPAQAVAAARCASRLTRRSLATQEYAQDRYWLCTPVTNHRCCFARISAVTPAHRAMLKDLSPLDA